MLHVLVGFIQLSIVASLTWPTGKDYKWTHASYPDQTVMASGCVKHQLPDLLFIGTGHAGTTSLASLLDQHDFLKYGSRKEHNFFSCPKDGTECARDLEEYRSGFAVDCSVNYTFDASENYFDIALHSEEDPRTANYDAGLSRVKHVHDILPDAKILVVIRDPVDCYFSQGIEDPHEMHEAGGVSKYFHAMKAWMSVYHPDNILVLKAEDAFNDMQIAANRVFSFMNLKGHTMGWKAMGELANAGRRRSSRRPSLDERKRFYAYEDNMRNKIALEHLVGLKFEWEGSQ